MTPACAMGVEWPRVPPGLGELSGAQWCGGSVGVEGWTLRSAIHKWQLSGQTMRSPSLVSGVHSVVCSSWPIALHASMLLSVGPSSATASLLLLSDRCTMSVTDKRAGQG